MASPCAGRACVRRRSRPLQPVDLSEFQYVIGMEAKNVRAIQVTAKPRLTQRLWVRGIASHVLSRV